MKKKTAISEWIILIGNSIKGRVFQIVIVIGICGLLKHHYSTASPDQLRWILCPTAFATEMITGENFTFVRNEGYVSSDRFLVIAKSCAGVNFMILAIILIALAHVISAGKERNGIYKMIGAVMAGYAVTIIVNTMRIAGAIHLYSLPIYGGVVTPAAVHRLEGILVYFVALRVLYGVSLRIGKKIGKSPPGSSVIHSIIPLIAYLSLMILVPLLRGALKENPERFCFHSLFVAGCPVLFILIVWGIKGFRLLFRSTRMCRHRLHNRNSITIPVRMIHLMNSIFK
ncbi:MAG: exosortase K [Chitinivibrionales bacterium]|nr:exosortase K [Chitinivibrionales bacterium]